MVKVPWLMFVTPLIFVGFVTFAALGMYRDYPNELPSTSVGSLAPELT